MPMPAHPSYYAHVSRVLDAALANGGSARYRLPTASAATRWRLEAYAFRKLLLRREERLAPPGILPRTPYDDLRIRISKDEPEVCIITPNDPQGTLTSADGTVLALGPTIDEANEDTLLREARELKEALGNDL